MFDRKMMNPSYTEFGIGANSIYYGGYNALRTVKERWTFNNPSTTHPSSYVTNGHNYTYGDFFYEDAWFIRVQNVTLGYTLSPRTLAKIKCISNLRIHTDKLSMKAYYKLILSFSLTALITVVGIISCGMMFFDLKLHMEAPAYGMLVSIDNLLSALYIEKIVFCLSDIYKQGKNIDIEVNRYRRERVAAS